MVVIRIILALLAYSPLVAFAAPHAMPQADGTDSAPPKANKLYSGAWSSFPTMEKWISFDNMVSACTKSNLVSLPRRDRPSFPLISSWDQQLNLSENSSTPICSPCLQLEAPSRMVSKTSLRPLAYLGNLITGKSSSLHGSVSKRLPAVYDSLRESLGLSTIHLGLALGEKKRTKKRN